MSDHFFSAGPGQLTIFREGRSPSIAYGFGSGLAIDVGGIKHSNSIGASFQSGNAEASGVGTASADGNVFSSGTGHAHTNPNTYYRAAYPVYSTPYARPTYSYPYNLGYNHFGAPQLRNSYGNAIASAQSSGPFTTAIAQSQNEPFRSVASATNFGSYQSRHNFRNPGFEGAAVASALSTGYGATAASFSDGSGTATSLAQTRDEQGGYNTAVSSLENGVGVSSAQTVQQNGGETQHSGATAINGPGIQGSQSHAFKTGAGTYY